MTEMTTIENWTPTTTASGRVVWVDANDPTDDDNNEVVLEMRAENAAYHAAPPSVEVGRVLHHEGHHVSTIAVNGERWFTVAVWCGKVEVAAWHRYHCGPDDDGVPVVKTFTQRRREWRPSPGGAALLRLRPPGAGRHISRTWEEVEVVRKEPNGSFLVELPRPWRGTAHVLRSNLQEPCRTHTVGGTGQPRRPVVPGGHLLATRWACEEARRVWETRRGW